MILICWSADKRIITAVPVKPDVSVIIVRYSEIGLKSLPVRIRFENQMRDAMLSMLAADGVEAIVEKGDARFYVRTSDTEKAIKSLKKVFGIGSLSVAEITSSSMEDICDAAAAYSEGKLSEGETFAVRAKREGSHPYKSTDVGREAGSAIFEKNKHLGIRVDLTSPEKVFYIEVRENKAYIFDSYVRCHAGLPVGTQGRAVAILDGDRSSLSAWLMMKRGCRIFARGTDTAGILKHYDPDMKFIEWDKEDPYNVMGYVLGTDLKGIGKVNVADYPAPVYFPTATMSDAEVAEAIENLKEECKI